MAEEKEAVQAKQDKNVLLALLCYLGILLLIPLLTAGRKDAYVKFHLKQGIVLLIAWTGMWILTFILVLIPVLGWILIVLIWIFLLVANIMGIVNSLTGKEAELPLIGKYAGKIRI